MYEEELEIIDDEPSMSALYWDQERYSEEYYWAVQERRYQEENDDE